MGASVGTLPVPDQKPPPPVRGETSSSAVAAREKAAVEARFVMAAGRPRDIDRFRIRLLEACKRPRFAEAARYAKPVGGGKKAEGPSIRFVEEALRHFGNVDMQAPVVFDDEERRIVRVSATDLETNTSYSKDVILEKTVERHQPRQGEQVLRSRQNSRGQTVYLIVADEDAFLVKQGANVSKATREVGLRVLPSDIVEEAIVQVQETLHTEDAKDPTAARKRLTDAFYGQGIMPAQLAELLGHPLESVTPAELGLLRTIYTTLRDGEASWAEIAEAFGAKRRTGNGGAAPGDEDPHAQGTEALRQKIEHKKAEMKPDQLPSPAATTEAPQEDLKLDQEISSRERKRS